MKSYKISMTNSNNLSIAKRDTFNQIQHDTYVLLKNLSGFYSEETKLLVYHLYEQGYTVQKVADILGVSKQAIGMRYPKGVRS